MNFRLSALVLVLGTATLFGQSSTPSKNPPAKTTPTKGPKKNDSPTGYQKDGLRGFTLFFSEESLAQNKKSKYDRSPFEALELELITVEKVIPADKVKQLKAVPIWVEWNETIDLGAVNGRSGQAVAVFYGGHQASLLGDSLINKSNSVTILSLKKLTEEHQPKIDSGRCVTLHELAHAYQFLFLNPMVNAQVKPVFQQAMERKLYDPSLYIATKDSEYFAELTCAYLDRLHHTPKNRAELKTHDPKGFELMEKSWGKIVEKKDPVASKELKLPSPDGDGKYSLDLKTENLRFIETIAGPLPSAADIKGRPLLLWFWNSKHPGSLGALNKVTALAREYRDFGLLAVGVHSSGGADDEIRTFAKERDMPFPIARGFSIGRSEEFLLPHWMLFDRTGKCVFRGDNTDGEPHLRVTMGKAILAKTQKDEFVRGARPVVDLLERGATPQAVFARLTSALDGTTGPTADDLNLILTTMTEGGKKAINQAREEMKDEPVNTFFHLEALAVTFKGSPVAKEANELLTKLRSNTKVAAELRARPSLEAIRKLDTQLSGKERSFNPKTPEFQQTNADLLKKLNDAVTKMRKAHPEVRATDEASKIAARWSPSEK